MIPIDLHTHSTISDGQLTPRALVQLAHQRGCQLFALTDHDSLDGLLDAADESARLGMRFVSGVEISVSWGSHALHVVGLHIDPLYPTLCDGLKRIRAGRWARAEAMAASLAQAGIPNTLEGAVRYAQNPEMISRAHFARYLVEIGKATNINGVFQKFLRPKRPGYVEHEWAPLHEAIGWIVEAGGIAVLAHPGRYEMGEEALLILLTEFRRLGGKAIEVVSGCHKAHEIDRFAQLAHQLDYLASCGTDYHGPNKSNHQPGLNQALPPRCIPLWTDWLANI